MDWGCYKDRSKTVVGSHADVNDYREFVLAREAIKGPENNIALNAVRSR